MFEHWEKIERRMQKCKKIMCVPEYTPNSMYLTLLISMTFEGLSFKYFQKYLPAPNSSTVFIIYNSLARVHIIIIIILYIGE